MDSNILRRRGFSLLELSLIFVIIATLMLEASYLACKAKQFACSQRVAAELNTIADASIEYYMEEGVWPQDVSILRPDYLNARVTGLNPFGNAYTITSGNSTVTVSTLLPKGLLNASSFGSEAVVVNQGSNDLASVTKPLGSALWKLQYDKKYTYGQ